MKKTFKLANSTRMLWKSLKNLCFTLKIRHYETFNDDDCVWHLESIQLTAFMCLGSSTAWRWKIVCDSIHSGVEHSKLRDSFRFTLKIQFSFSIYLFTEWKSIERRNRRKKSKSFLFIPTIWILWFMNVD